AKAGDVILLDNPPFNLTDDIRRQAIEMVEYDCRHGRVLTRLHFKAGPRTAAAKNDPVLMAIADAAVSCNNPFQLDRSALDSTAYLDSTP
ncbi:MAG: hypothetical protein ABIH23_35055, partial [bacterium]